MGFISILVVNGAAYSIVSYVDSLQIQAQEQDRYSRAQDYFRRIEIRFESYIAAAQTLRDRTLKKQGLTKEDFERESDIIQNYFRGFQALNYIRPDGLLTWITPLKGNEQALGQNLFDNTYVGDLLRQPIAQRKMILSPPLKLYQGGRGLVIYFPLREGEIFHGWMNIVFRAVPFFQDILTLDEKRAYSLIIEDSLTGEEIYSEKINESLEDKPHFYEFKIQDRSWRIGLVPLRPSVYSTYRDLTIFVFFLFSLVLGIVVKLYYDRWDQVRYNLHEALKEATLLQVLGHDLSSPLTMGELLVDKLERLSGDNKKLKVPLLELRNVLHVQFEILNSIRDLQLFKKRQKEIFLGPVSIYEAYLNAAQVFSKSIETKKIEFKINLDKENDIEILSHKVYFENNVFNNLISNALKYSPVQGVVEVHARVIDDQVFIDVMDNGRGMEEESMKRFQRGESLPSQSGTAGESGSGFGLLLVKNFVELLGGEITVSLRLSGGTTFTLVFFKG